MNQNARRNVKFPLGIVVHVNMYVLLGKLSVPIENYRYVCDTHNNCTDVRFYRKSIFQDRPFLPSITLNKVFEINDLYLPLRRFWDTSRIYASTALVPFPSFEVNYSRQ